MEKGHEFYWYRAKWIGIFTVLFMFVGHAYRYMNLAYTDDSVEIIQSTDRIWQFQLGRFLQPVYWQIRGDIVVPYLIGLLSVLWLAGAIYLIVSMMDIRSKVSYAIICAVLSCNSTLSVANATYISWSDVYMLSLFCAMIGVYVWQRFRYGFILTAGFLCASMALYQAYFQTAILMCLMVLVKRALDGWKVARLIEEGIKAIAALVLGLILYELCVRFVEYAAEISRATTYNGIGNVGSFLNGSILGLLRETYLYPFFYMMDIPAYNSRMTGIAYGLVLVIAVIAIILLMMKRCIASLNRVFAVVMVLLMPLGMNAVYFIANGVVHNLMMYSFFLLMVFPVYLLENLVAEQGDRIYIGNITRMGCIALLALTCYNHVIYANQLYIRRDLEFQSTLSVMTRVLDRAEQTEGYETGITPVAIVGTMYNSPLSMERPGFEHLKLEKDYMNTNFYATTGEYFYPWYFWEILGYPFNLVSEDVRWKIADEREVRLMPVFPQEGSCQMRDGVMVIKLGTVMPPSE